MSILRSFLVYCFIFYSSTILALPTDSLPKTTIYKTSIKYFYEKDFIYGKTEQHFLDSSVSTVHRVNPALDLQYNYLSTLGSASDAQQFSINLNLFTLTSIRSYDLQMFQSDSIKSFRTNKRFTELQYHTGNFKEQRISVFHTQNISQNWNAGINFDRQGVKDFMNYSNTFRSRFSIYTHYNAPGKKYNLFAHAIWNSIKNGVNGGLASDSLFDNTTVTNVGIKGLAYNISDAEQNVRKKTFYLSQYYDLGKVTNDSSGNIIHSKPGIRLHHQISILRKSFVYKDNTSDSSYYSDFFYGSSTYDSLHSDEVTNKFTVQLPSDTSYNSAFFRNWSSGIFVEYQHIKYGQRTDSSWNNISVGTNVFLRSDSASPQIFVEAIYVFHGIDKENYRFELKTFTPEYNFGKVGLDILAGKSSADLIFRWYDSNNFIWKNNFTPVKNLKIGLSYVLNKYQFSIHANYMSVGNYVYMNENAIPDQFNGTLSINQLNVNKNFIYRYWHFDNKFIFQKTDQDNIINLPSFVSDQSLYFEKDYYKKALLVAIGISANYNSSYYANEFMPANAMFYLQNTTKTGGYWRFDLFLNAQIKTARLFLKFENLADDLIKASYYLTPHYPMPGRVVKFGIVWRFFDQ